MMTEEEIRINKQRAYWQDKLRTQLDHLMFASQEGDEQLHRDILEDLGTSVLCLWRFDRRLTKTRKEQEAETLAKVE